MKGTKGITLPVDRLLASAWRRAAAGAILRGIGYGAAGGGVATAAFLMTERLLPAQWPLWPAAALAVASIVAGIVVQVARMPARPALARQLDRALLLDDRLSTVTALDDGVRADGAFAQLVRADSDRRVAGVRAGDAIPLRVSRAWAWAAGSLLALCLVAWLAPWRSPARPDSAPPLSPEALASRASTAVEIRSAIDRIQQDVSRRPDPDEPTLAVRERLEELERIAAQLDPASASSASSDEASPAPDRAAAVVEELAALREAEALAAAAEADEAARRFSTLGDLAEPPRSPDEAREFAQALRHGRFDDAASALEALERSVGRLSPTEREALSRYFQSLAERAQAEEDQSDQAKPLPDSAATSTVPKPAPEAGASPDEQPPQKLSPEQPASESPPKPVPSPGTAPPPSIPPHQPAAQHDEAARPRNDSGTEQDRSAAERDDQPTEPNGATANRNDPASGQPESPTQRADSPARRNDLAPQPSGDARGERDATEAKPLSDSQPPSPDGESRRAADPSNRSPSLSEALRRTAQQFAPDDASAPPDARGQPQAPQPSQPDTSAQPRPVSSAPPEAESPPSSEATKPSQGDGDLTRALREVAARRESAADRARDGRELRELAERIAGGTNPEEERQLERWSRAMAREHGTPSSPQEDPASQGRESPGRPTPRTDSPGAATSRPHVTQGPPGDPNNAGGAPDGTAGDVPSSPDAYDTPLGSAQEDLDLRRPGDGQHSSETIAEWFDDLPPTEGGAAATERRVQRVSATRRAAERAIERRDVPPRYHDLMRRYFGRFEDATEQAAGPPAAAKPPAVAPGAPATPAGPAPPPASGSTGAK